MAEFPYRTNFNTAGTLAVQAGLQNQPRPGQHRFAVRGHSDNSSTSVPQTDSPGAIPGVSTKFLTGCIVLVKSCYRGMTTGCFIATTLEAVAVELP